MSHYARGRAFEYRIKQRFIDAGYLVVRAAQSKGPADLVAIRSGMKPVLIQCKIGKTWSSIKDWNEFLALCESLDAIPVFASTHSRKTFIKRMLSPKPGKEGLLSIEFNPKDLFVSKEEVLLHLAGLPESLKSV